MTEETVYVIHNVWTDDNSNEFSQIWAVHKTKKEADAELDRQRANYPHEDFFVSEEPLFD